VTRAVPWPAPGLTAAALDLQASEVEALDRRGVGERALAIEVARTSAHAIGCPCRWCLFDLIKAGSTWAKTALREASRGVVTVVVDVRTIPMDAPPDPRPKPVKLMDLGGVSFTFRLGKVT